MYRRILLKLSGEQLQGEFESGFDVARATWIAREIQKVKNAEIVIMIGGGNFIRGAQLAGNGVGRVTADNIGMLATMMNALALTDVFNANGLEARALTNIKSDQVADQFTHRRALSHLNKKRVVVIAGGIGRPYLTTDTAAVNLALELDCDAILKATKVDGVYDADPMRVPEAKRFDTLSYQEALEHPAIRVMDKAALGLAAEHGTPVIVFELLKEGNVAKVVSGVPIGTTIG